MNHKTAARHGVDGGWHYVSNRRGGYPLGYCAQHEPHPTELEARECYSRFLRETTIHLNRGEKPDEQRHCAICEAWTQKYATAGDPAFPEFVHLCDEHMTAESVLAALPHLNEPAGDSWES